MIDAAAYLVTAKKLLESTVTEADLRRAISTAYYAVFHHACRHFSEIVLPAGDASYLSVWSQAYRYLDHGPAKQRCIEVRKHGTTFPPGILAFAAAFIVLQERRIEADYNPLEVFPEADTRTLVTSAESAISAFDAEPAAAKRAFVLILGLRPKNR